MPSAKLGAQCARSVKRGGGGWSIIESTAIGDSILYEPFVPGERRFVKRQLNIRAVSARCVVMIAVPMRLNSITTIFPIRSLVYQKKDIPEAGKRLRGSLISASWYAPIATVNFTRS